MKRVVKEYKSGKSYNPVGKCIYCGSTENLTNEHIIPYGLNGQWILPKSSCKKCAKITADFEKEVLRNQFLDIRTSLGLKSRNRNNRPVLLPLKVKKDGKEEVMLLPPNEHFTTACFLEYPLPAYIDGRNYEEGIEIIAHSVIGLRDLEEIAEKHKINEVEISLTFDRVDSFPRLLAKIAYGFTVAHFGLNCFEKSFLPKVIMGEDKQICRYVGTCTDKTMQAKNTIHNFTIKVNEMHEIVARIKLFSYTEAPEYLVVVGILREEIYKSNLSKDELISLVHCET